MDKMKQLYEKVAADSTLQAKFSQIMKEAEKAGQKETEAKLTAFAKEAGYAISLDEMRVYFQELAEQDKGLLSDAELDMVAGGKSFNGIGNTIGSVITLGITCVTGSVLWELERMDGESSMGCKDHFQ
ncbi:MAG: Nif11 family protein [Eubacteriales bacterium]|nr:Nif11 family protein [Eubacteriales bacterium]